MFDFTHASSVGSPIAPCEPAQQDSFPDQYLASPPPQEPSNVPSAPESDTQSDKEDWIEIELVDEESNPVPGMQVCVEDADGKRHWGKLDDNGRFRLEGIEPGNCRVSFPFLNECAWIKG